MQRYSVLLVDDEEDVIQVIMKKIDWESMGFQVSGYAHNGVEALEMAEECVPDVVLTDIKMPYMDGLAMSRKLKEQYPNIKIIIFSGFDEFEYAKEAGKLMLFLAAGSLVMTVLLYFQVIAAVVQIVVWIIVFGILWKKMDERYGA